jgi:nitroreductase
MTEHPKHAASDHEILDVIRRRWSPRAFDPSREVPAADLRTMFEAARWAPSSYNEQPWRFVVVDRFRTPEAFAGMVATLHANNEGWARHAPVLVLVSISTRLTRTGGVNQAAAYDAGQAVGFLTLQATNLGLAVRQMEGFDRDAARAAFGIPADYEPIVTMAVGYTGDPGALAVERHRLAETTPRQRQAAGAFVYDAVWGKAL